MKKHLAIVCGIFYPEPSPTGLCVKRFADLLSGEYEIEIICLSENEEHGLFYNGDSIRIHKLAGRRMSAESKSTGIVRKIIHMLGSVQIKTQMLGNLTWYRKAAFQKLEEIHRSHEFDAVFSICSPFAAHCAAKDFKTSYPSVHWCGYTVDPYSTNNRIRPFGCSQKKLTQVEKKILLSMDSVLLSQEVFNSKTEVYQGCQRCQKLPYILPELESDTGERRFFAEEDINCVYAGSFYKDIRNPECMLKMFSCLNDPRIKLHLFSKGCEELVKKYSERSSFIVVHEQVPAIEMAQIYRDADILVNIGNAIPEFLPSKTFEYIATGKPIISFYYNVDEILGKYPLCIQLQNTYVSDRSHLLKEFVLENGRKIVEPGEVRKLYYENSIDHVLEILLGALRA